MILSFSIGRLCDRKNKGATYAIVFFAVCHIEIFQMHL
jgi:hypothetical protein